MVFFFSQVHATLPRVVFHVQDEALLVCQTCKVKHIPEVCSTVKLVFCCLTFQSPLYVGVKMQVLLPYISSLLYVSVKMMFYSKCPFMAGYLKMHALFLGHGRSSITH